MLNKKGFTLLELIIVVIILGILATLAISQYSRIIEKSRSAEARAVLGSIRTRAAAIYLERNNSCADAGYPCTNANLGISATGDFPGPAAGQCNTSNYFWYNVTANVANGITVLATRCAAGGKAPQGLAADTVQLQSDFSPGGSETWTMTGRFI